MNEIKVFGDKVKQDEEGRLSLNDLYGIAMEGGVEGKSEPREWRRKSGEDFINHISKNLNVAVERIIKSKRGKGGGTYAHWQVALAYAKYLSHELHEHVNKVYAGYLTASPEMAIDMVDRMDAKSAKWVEARAQGRQQRLSFTQTLKEHGVSEGWQYGVCTNSIYEPILGGKAKDVKKERGLPTKANLRDAMTLKEIMATGLAEALATESIEENESVGFKSCNSECLSAAEKVRSIL